jgi:MoaA/NifB/PqqE/SkfB family radical SAM enzyme
MTFTPTKKCNLNCKQCHQKGIDKEERKQLDLSFDDIKKLIKNINTIKTVNTIGGEIFVRKDMIDILKYFDKKNINLKIATNGYNLTDALINDITRLKNVLNIAISIDGPKEIHNQIRGREDAFQQSINAIRMFKKLGFKVFINSVLMPENIKYIRNILNIGYDLNVDRITLTPVMYKKSTDLSDVQKIVDCTNINLQECEGSFFDNQQFNDVKLIMKEYRARGLFCRLISLDHTFNNKIFCSQMFQLFVDEHGDVLFCPFINKKFGNIVDTPITEIWNSKESCEFRKNFANNGGFSFCHQCCAARIGKKYDKIC